MPLDTLTCLDCICFDRGQSLEMFALCWELRDEGLCQKQVVLKLAQIRQGIPVVIEGECAVKRE